MASALDLIIEALRSKRRRELAEKQAMYAQVAPSAQFKVQPPSDYGAAQAVPLPNYPVK